MAEFSWTDRLLKAALGPALFCGWWYFAPNYSTFFSKPLGQLTIAKIAWPVGWLLLLVPWLYGNRPLRTAVSLGLGLRCSIACT
jgi:hypothetical protein